jgi:hypothetical protein
MTRVIEWIVSLLIVVALFVAIGVFLPSKRSVSHEVETNRPMSTVNDLLGSFTRFKDWNALINHDPKMRLTVSGPASGVGAKLAYASDDGLVGEGSWEVIEEVPGERIVYALDTPGRGQNKKMTFTFERTGQRNQNIKITQRYTVDYGWDLIGRYAGLYVTDNVGDDIKRGLTKFGNLLATIPRFDYSGHPAPFEFADLPAQNVLLATATAKRANDEIAVAMTNQLKWIEQVMAKNDLEAAGPMRIVTNEFSTDSYGFDVVVPIRRKGTGPAPAGDDADDGDEPAAGEGEAEAAADIGTVATVAEAAGSIADAGASTAALERFDVKVEGPVIYAQVPAMRAAVTDYLGPAPGLARVRDLVRAWAMVRGSETTGRPFEEYLSPIRNMLDEDAKFRVYWPVKVPGVEEALIVQIAPEPVEEKDDGSIVDPDAPATEAPAGDAPADAPAEAPAGA